MRVRTRVIGLFVAMLLSPIMGAGALAQTVEGTDTDEVSVQVHSGTFTVSIEAGTFNAVQPGEESTGSISMTVVDERANGEDWHVTAGHDEWTGDSPEGAQTFNAYFRWNVAASPAGSVDLEGGGELTIASNSSRMFSSIGSPGTVTVSGDATVTIPEGDSQQVNLRSGTYSTTITVELNTDP